MNTGSGCPLGEVLAASRSRILATWLARTLDTYPEHASHFLAREKDPFRNPVGHALQQTLPALFDELVGESNPARLADLLDAILQIRAVQDFTPSQAVGFLLLLKTAARESLEDQARPSEEVLSALDARMDALMLLAFDLFMKHRERIYTLRLNEAKRMLAHAERTHAGGQG
jgi:hypothetical protein